MSHAIAATAGMIDSACFHLDDRRPYNGNFSSASPPLQTNISGSQWKFYPHLNNSSNFLSSRVVSTIFNGLSIDHLSSEVYKVQTMEML